MSYTYHVCSYMYSVISLEIRKIIPDSANITVDAVFNCQLECVCYILHSQGTALHPAVLSYTLVNISNNYVYGLLQASSNVMLGANCIRYSRPLLLVLLKSLRD